MQFELCRHCGEQTIQASKCQSCLKPFKFVCPECNILYEEYHSECATAPILQKIVIE